MSASEFSDRGRQIYVADQFIPCRTRRHARTADVEWHANIFLIRGQLAGVQAVLSKMKSVVRSEEDVGVVELSGGFQSVDDVLDEVLHGKHGLKTLAEEVVHLPLAGQTEERTRLYPRRLGGDVGFVIRRRTRRGCTLERVGMARCGRSGLVRCIRRNKEEEGLLVRCVFLDEARRLL